MVKIKKGSSAPVGASPAKQAPLPKIPWQENNSILIWNLLSECEKEENRKVLFGKKDDENSSSENKIAVCKRVASAVVPALYAPDGTVAGERVKAKIAWLITTYRAHVMPIKATGGGVREEQDSQDSQEELTADTSSWIAGIPRAGPDENTSTFSKNIWQQTEEKWPFFPRMHELLCTCPNVVPPAITTGVGPHGEATVYYQVAPPVSSLPGWDDAIDPTLRGLDVNHAQMMLPAPSQAITAPPATPQDRLSLAMQKAGCSIKPVSKCLTFEDHMVDITEKNLALVKKHHHAEAKRAQAQISHKRQKLSVKQKEVHLQEFQQGLITREEYRTLVYGKGLSADVEEDSSSSSESDSSEESSSDEEGIGGAYGASDDIVGHGWTR
ncbi:hypothetical protein OH76DRAFT_1556319 [Lentinus brumalis]|uniref:Uncharacterized protein n=1 Tax=Lentinus brumalis TaxID=2498619 RepID=A0A371DAU6_9APHY|nr:hypothetical protein OH76DRAFT_1556319 [Polyporus brumalis]